MKKGNKPSFHQSASGPTAKELYQAFFKKVQDSYQADKVKDGLFAAMMDVALVNDGPVGIDYSCLDNEVHPQQPNPLPSFKERADMLRSPFRSIQTLQKRTTQFLLAQVAPARRAMKARQSRPMQTS